MRVWAAFVVAAVATSVTPAFAGSADGTAPATAQVDADEEAARRWIAINLQAFSSNSPEPSELAAITTGLEGARVIGIGEATHGSHEDLTFKAALIKQLVRGGRIDVIALEANRAVEVALDGYVRRGVGDPVALVRSPSFFRIWRTEEFVDLITWLRAWRSPAASRSRSSELIYKTAALMPKRHLLS
ncbi:erythromycin esterase family protein [Parafrankia sp. BMG5.11]|uniref:erythromycin esterase family protein n=1 Tax=Parafrankia sp. BMG5.11 TaxID=222540 RepID=UPI00103B44B3|nr:erythromycin esterase family protein [Parafrankia sp. BMG5.11]TCJ38386.1 hypothetical protein E0504_15665 [Parafrankia sp. BMG5.11]